MAGIGYPGKPKDEQTSTFLEIISFVFNQRRFHNPAHRTPPNGLGDKHAAG
jgi:hypothetical protein